MSEIRAKGFALAGCWEWVEANLSDAEKNQVLERLPEDCRATLPAFDEGTWYPVAWFDAVVASVAEVKGSTPEEHREIVYELIRYMAKRNLSSVDEAPRAVHDSNGACASAREVLAEVL